MTMNRWVGFFCAVALLIFRSPHSFAVDDARLQAVEASVQIQEAPPTIQLVWPQPESLPNRYRISKRQGNADWSEVAVLDGSATSWTDSNVNAGQRYEYRVIKEADTYL